MRTLLSLLLLQVAQLIHAADFPPGSPAFSTSYEAAAKRAAKTGKPMIIVFSAGYCPPCQQMLKTVYPSKEVQALHSSFEWAYIDVSQPEAEATVRKFDVQPIPHLQFVTAQGKPFSNWIGHASAAQLADIMKHVIKETAQP